jgi:glycosyltransferase involved in cell wall biosynthesis
LDYFSDQDELTLHICGSVENEKDFVEMYKKELFDTKNIIYHGFVNIESKKFANILTSCSFVIFPSCSEGGAPSVLTVIGNGGLVPIITKETTISTGNEIFIETLDYNGIGNAVKKAMKIDKYELKKLEKKNLDFVLNFHTKDNYKKNLKLLITKILEQNHEM